MNHEKKFVDGVELYPYHTSSGDLEWVTLEVNVYHANDNLYLGLLHYDKEEGFINQYGSVTTNRIGMPYLFAAIDTEKNGPAIVPFLVENGFGEDTGKCVSSGHNEFPIFKFSEEKLREVCPEEFSFYEKARKGNALRDSQVWKVPSQLDESLGSASGRKPGLDEKIKKVGKEKQHTEKPTQESSRTHPKDSRDI